jgi:hypothetical protein
MPETPQNPTEGEVVATWLARVGRADGEEGFWAWEYVQQAGSNQKWRLILALLFAAANDPSVELIGAGPLEDFVSMAGSVAELGNDSWIRVIEIEARKNPKLRQALEVAYPDPLNPPELWERLDSILGASISERHPLKHSSPADTESWNQLNKTRRMWLGSRLLEEYELPDDSLLM